EWVEQFATSEKPQNPKRWPRDAFPIQPLRSWGRWLASDIDVHPHVVEASKHLQTAEELAHIIGAWGPEGFVGWFRREVPAWWRYGLDHEAAGIPRSEFLARWGTPIYVPPDADILDFARLLGDHGYIEEFRRVGSTLGHWLSRPT